MIVAPRKAARRDAYRSFDSAAKVRARRDSRGTRPSRAMPMRDVLTCIACRLCKRLAENSCAAIHRESIALRRIPDDPVRPGLGGFLHGIVFHRALQWRHRASTWHPADSLENMRLKVAL